MVERKAIVFMLLKVFIVCLIVVIGSLGCEGIFTKNYDCEDDDSPPPMLLKSLDDPFELAWGQTAILPDRTQMTFAELLRDSRCPSDVDCASNGSVMIALEFTGEQDTQRLELDSVTSTLRGGEKWPQVYAQGYSVALLSVSPPAPPHTIEIPHCAYVVTLQVK